MSAERDFHYVLAAALVPVVSLPLTWWLAWRQVRLGGTSPNRRVWRRRIVTVAAIDTFVSAVLVVAMVLAPGGPDFSHARGSPKMGIQLDADYVGPGARVSSVWKGSPAQQAGLKQGDVVLSVDGEPVADWNDLSSRIATGMDRQLRTLQVQRDDDRLELYGVPKAGLQLDSGGESAFTTRGDKSCREAWSEHARGGLGSVVVGTVLVLLLWLRARRRQPRARHRWVAVVVPLALAPIISAGCAHTACVVTGGWSIGGLLVGLIGQGLALLMLGALILWLLRGELTAVVGPMLSTGQASRFGVFYIIAALARAVAALLAVSMLFPELQAAQDTGVTMLFESVDDPLGRAMMVTAAVVIAPVAEEVIFRGVLLPGLAQSMRPSVALIVSAAVFALFHVPSHGAGAVVPGLLGLVFGWARLRTGGLAAPILLHGANNLLVTVLAWG